MLFSLVCVCIKCFHTVVVVEKIEVVIVKVIIVDIGVKVVEIVVVLVPTVQNDLVLYIYIYILCHLFAIVKWFPHIHTVLSESSTYCFPVKHGLIDLSLDSVLLGPDGMDAQVDEGLYCPRMSKTPFSRVTYQNIKSIC